MSRTLKPGDRISHYRIVGPLGAGGMGEVYRVSDQSLPRDAALKILPRDLVRSEERLRRFMLEAKSASSLNHPHIVTIYEIGRDRVHAADGGTPPDTSPLDFISMELISGETLSVKIHQQKTELRTLLAWLAQAAEGLAKAHAAGIVHRDLKPSNIMVSQDGYAKVLDFGLAKLIEPRATDADITSASTLTAEQTSDGAVLGTVGYMAPEQVLGKRVDFRTDIFSFGAILYEAATRRQAFAAESSVETMHQILHQAPAPIESLNPEAPVELRRLIRRCLAKDPNQRLDSMRTLALELREIVEEYNSRSASTSSGSASGATIAASQSRQNRFRRVALPIAVIAVAVLGIWLGKTRPWQSVPAAGRPLEWKQMTVLGNATASDISPDGTAIAYVVPQLDGTYHVVVQDAAGGDAIEVFNGTAVMPPQWTGGGGEILVPGVSKDSTSGTWLVPRMGGQPRTLPLRRGMTQLSPDGASVAQTGLPWKRILLTQLSNGDTTWIDLEPKFTWLRESEWSPDGRSILFVVSDETRTSVWTMRRDGRHQQKVYESPHKVQAHWAPREDAIYCLRQPGHRGELIKIYLRRDGSAASRTPRVLISEPGLLLDSFGVSRDGHRLVCTRGTGYSNVWVWDRRLGSHGSAAQPRQMTQGTAYIESPALSPDGRRLAFLSNRGGVSNVHVLSLEDGSSKQATFLKSDAGCVAWSPDGKTLAFTANDGDSMRVWHVASSGGAAAPFRRTIVGTAPMISWAPAPKLLYGRPGNRNCNLLDVETEAERPLVDNDSVGWMFYPVSSPDGKHVAVGWNRRPAHGLWVISTDDRSQVRVAGLPMHRGAKRWSDDGSALLVVADLPPWRIVRVGFPGGDTTTVLRFPLEGDRGDPLQMDFTPDLRRVVYTSGESHSDIWLVENFDPEVR